MQTAPARGPFAVLVGSHVGAPRYTSVVPGSPDTTEEVRQLQLAAIRSMTPARRIEIAIEMSELAAQISAAGADRRARTSDT